MESLLAGRHVVLCGDEGINVPQIRFNPFHPSSIQRMMASCLLILNNIDGKGFA
jgi:aspartate oxidase